MYKHFFKKHGIRFALLLACIISILFVLSYFIYPNSEARETNSGELWYYGLMFTILGLAIVCLKGFNNRMMLFLGIATTMLEYVISSFMMSLNPTINTYVMTWYIAPLFTIAAFHYRMPLMLRIGDILIRFKRTRNVGFKLLDKTADTNMGANITAILKVCWFGYLAISVYYHYFFWHFNIHPQGPFLYGYYIRDMEVTLGLPVVSGYMSYIFNIQVYMILIVLFRSGIQEFYIRDLVGHVPARINYLFQTR